MKPPVKKGEGRAVMAVVAIIILFGIAGGGGKNTSTEPAKSAEPAPPSCKSDWTKCANNSDMANNFSGWSRAAVDCKFAANDRAKYGTPEWPWIYFGKINGGTNYLDGVAVLIEDDVKFQNGFGAMVRSRVDCKYDLRTNKVIDVVIGAR